MPASVALQPAVALAPLPSTRAFDLPDAIVYGGLLAALLDAASAEFDALDDCFAQLALAAHPATCPVWSIHRWEIELGLGVDTSLTPAERQSRVALRFIGLRGPVGPYLVEQVRLAARQSAPPTQIARAGRWNVWKLAEPGWPGDSAFLAAESRLFVGSKASTGDHVAAWDSCLGLTVHQLDMMHVAALQELAISEMDGGHCPPITCAPEFLLDAIDALPLDQVDPMTQDLFEFCSDDPPGWVLERFSLRTRLGPLSMEQVDAIDLVELVAPLPADYLLDEVHAMPLDVTDPTALDRLEP